MLGNAALVVGQTISGPERVYRCVCYCSMPRRRRASRAPPRRAFGLSFRPAAERHAAFLRSGRISVSCRPRRRHLPHASRLSLGQEETCLGNVPSTTRAQTVLRERSVRSSTVGRRRMRDAIRFSWTRQVQTEASFSDPQASRPRASGLEACRELLQRSLYLLNPF